MANTPTVQEVISWATARLGSKKYIQRCQAFVADACSVGRKYPRYSQDTATMAWKAWGKYRTKTGIPAGAAVYFNGTGAAGHVGLSLGDGRYIHAAGKKGVIISNISSANGFRGWGWNGNVIPRGASTTATTSTASTSKKTASTTTSKNTNVASAVATAAASVKETKEITTISVKSVQGNTGKRKTSALSSSNTKLLDSGVEILIENDKIYNPVIEGDVVLESERKSGPSSLSFNVITDETLNIQEGNPVSLKINGTRLFYGYIFKKSRKDPKVISVTCYDQMRYLKNKDTIVYSGKTYSQLLKMIAADYNLTCGDVADTGYVLPGRIEEDTLLDILFNAGDVTVLNTGKLFVLYDDFGKLTLKNITDMKLPLLIDKDTASEYNYSSSIDKNVYNRIKLAYDNGDTGAREVYVANDEDSQQRWGILQYYEKVQSSNSTVLQEKAKVLLKYYNKKQRSLDVNKCLGDVRVRGGSSLVVNLNLGDMVVQNYMVVEKVKHTFSNGSHFMDLKLSGIRGEFNV